MAKATYDEVHMDDELDTDDEFEMDDEDRNGHSPLELQESALGRLMSMNWSVYQSPIRKQKKLNFFINFDFDFDFYNLKNICN